ncbi:CLK4-associating serine arginine rich protein [Nesidiocoris tenuis]|uniref:CLK4-associating serine arginine rich protein n=1 Tax=Nesidiocoris tenuis TaxID=355587 RepID=A0ABN7B9Z6_9HEMI|nr:CLK4-associating serine arginine rich protein [Nesidiocoris tenuis]
MTSSVKCAILTVSDRCSRGETEDKSGPAIRNLLIKSSGSSNSSVFTVVKEDCVPDEANIIEDKLREWCKPDSIVNVVLTTGGTGFAPRDVTPEATLRVVDKTCPAITTAMTEASLRVTPLAMLSRSVSGIKNSTLIVNLPGSVKGATECLQVVLPCLPHASDLLADRLTTVQQTHMAMSRSNDLPRSKVSNFKAMDRERVSPWPMIAMDDAVKIVLDSAQTLETVVLPLSEVLGHVTSCEVRSTDNLPPFRASVKDGYAVHTSSGTGEFKVVSALTAGCAPDLAPDIRLKECVRVNTGGPVPPGADAVVQVEDTKLISVDDAGDELIVRILTQAQKDQDIRPIGCDIAEGELVLPAHTPIRSAEHGILASVGATSVSVFRKPVVAVLSTGNELVPAGEKLVPGTVRDSNMTTLRSLLIENGFAAYDMGIAEDTPDVMLRELRRSLTVADVVVTTGSVSMGEKDFLKNIITLDLGGDIKFGRVNMKPGKPTTFAVVRYNGKDKLVFSLPGNPVSATVMAHLVVLPALKKMSGHPKPFPATVSAIVDFDVKLDDRPEYRRTILDFSYEDGCARAKSTGTQMSSRLLSWRNANALLVLPSKKDKPDGILPKGTRVEALVVEKL